MSSSSYNPYLTPDADDDVFADADSGQDAPNGPVTLRHAYDGSRCPICAVAHDMTIDADAPVEIYAALDQIIDAMPASARLAKMIVTDGAIPAGQIYSSVMNRLARLDNTVAVGPVLRALIEVVGQLSGPEHLDVLIELYSIQQRILVIHTQIEMADKVVKNIDKYRSSDGDTPKSVAMLDQLLAQSISAMRAELDASVERYARLAEKAGVAVDETVISGHGAEETAGAQMGQKLLRYFAVASDLIGDDGAD